ncbi:hypothetical protein JR316_0002602 [Psilocybe cubensis]|uniref:Uncharacterized protein n=2 Tax=Psilocybe cubensis TaxID=181762 RepID=A0ACB8HDF8_PSICU|nr:hypothetical protein JR316_0002602 [Psilocybe cubensis]KAH9485692.1 hypothetical protein JR316_0002602 [Psilocybe cubensis]
MVKNTNPSIPTPTNNVVRGTTLVPDTPRSQKSFGRDVGVVQLRPAIAQEMDAELVRCPVTDFIETYLPFAPNDAEMAVLVEKLLKEINPSPVADGARITRNAAKPKSSILVGDEKAFRFRNYPKPGMITQSSHDSESSAYKGWLDIAHAIRNLKFYNDNRAANNFEYRNMPNKEIASDIKGSNNMIDAAFLRQNAHSKELRTTDIAVVIEQKRLKTASKRREAVSANAQIMNDDDPGVLIRVFAAFLFAKEAELGYDPTIVREPDGHYTFKFPDPKRENHSLLYRTINTLSEYRSNNITGRMARVYTVTRLDDQGAPYGNHLVLKDVWLDTSACTEEKIQESIFDDIETFWKNEKAPSVEMKKLKEKFKHLIENQEYKQYFLQIVLSFSGETTQEYPKSARIEKKILFDPSQKSAPPNPRSGTATPSSLVRDVGEDTRPPVDSEVEPRPIRGFEPKKQYRVIYNEVCKTVGKLETLGEVVDVLRQALIPLQLLFCAGWVHRDISSGNIMAYRQDLENGDQPWVVKLSDLEYAKKFPMPRCEPAADPKTGTPYFMPLEVMQKSYLFNAKQATLWAAPMVSASDIVGGALRATRKSDGLDASSKIVVHNFQHDLESLWWILVWTLTCRIGSDAAFAYGRTIFVNQMKPSYARAECFTDDAELLEKLIGFLPPSTSENSLPELVNVLRYLMNLHYVKRVGTRTHFNPEQYCSIYNDFDLVFDTMKATATEWSSIELITRKSTDSVEEESVAPIRKRQRADSEENVESQGDKRGDAAQSKPNKKKK